ncbi:MAG: division/cell wall cluster transcriptional repressor MraZ [Methyloligellaceae bacterium]
MDRFVSTYTKKIDAKGRVSVPAPFRTILARDGFEGGIYCYPSLDNCALDAGGQRLVDKIDGLIEQLGAYSDGHDPLATALFGESEILKIDADGRTIIPDRLREHAGIEKEVTFVGLGLKFQIWEPQQFEDYREKSRSQMADLRKLLGAGSRPTGGSEGVRET